MYMQAIIRFVKENLLAIALLALVVGYLLYSKTIQLGGARGVHLEGANMQVGGCAGGCQVGGGSQQGGCSQLGGCSDTWMQVGGGCGCTGGTAPIQSGGCREGSQMGVASFLVEGASSAPAEATTEAPAEAPAEVQVETDKQMPTQQTSGGPQAYDVDDVLMPVF
jgi:hypothetical protein